MARLHRGLFIEHKIATTNNNERAAGKIKTNNSEREAGKIKTNNNIEGEAGKIKTNNNERGGRQN